MSNNYVAGLDIGSQNIKVAIAEVKKEEKPSLIRVFKIPSQGIRRGVVDDFSEVTRSLNQTFTEIKKNSKNAIKNIYLGVSSQDTKIQSSKGIVAVSRADYEICKDDIDRVTEAAQAVNLPPNRMILHSIIQEFMVDGVGDIKDPVGMIGNRLEINSLIIDSFAPIIKNLSRCVEMAGGEISGLIFSPLAASRSILSKNQKELGTVLIDIGFGKTTMIVYEENKVLHTAVFPVGAANVTNDLAIGIKSSILAAEMIKFSFGSALAKEVSSREMIELRKIDPAARGSVSRRFIAEIIEIRLAEIMEFINNELKSINRSSKLPGGAILIGGGAKIPAIVDLIKQELRLPAQIGVPDISEFNLLRGEVSSQVEDPEFACAIGLILLGLDKTEKSSSVSFKKGFFRNLFKHFIP